MFRNSENSRKNYKDDYLTTSDISDHKNFRDRAKYGYTLF